MERWLREEVLPVYDAMQADPGWAIPAPQVTASLDALHAERLRRPGIARSVVYAPEAVEDLLQLYRYIAEHSGPERARGYPARIEAQCLSLAGFPER